MGAIWDWLSSTYAVLASVPFLVFPVVWLPAWLFLGDKKAAVQRAVDITAFFLIGSVAALYDQLFQTAFKGFYIILLGMLLFAGLLGNAQNRIRGKVDPPKLIRAVWRLSFLILSFFYIILLISTILVRIFAD